MFFRIRCGRQLVEVFRSVFKVRRKIWSNRNVTSNDVEPESSHNDNGNNEEKPKRRQEERELEEAEEYERREQAEEENEERDEEKQEKNKGDFSTYLSLLKEKEEHFRGASVIYSR